VDDQIKLPGGLALCERIRVSHVLMAPGAQLGLEAIGRYHGDGERLLRHVPSKPFSRL
jgi:hypothetical protein